jgi:hypothetical protein
VTNAVVVFVADFGLASAVAVRAPAAAGLVSAFVLAAAVVEPVVAVVSAPALIFAARAPAAFVSAFGLAAVAAQRDVAVASGPALIFFERALLALLLLFLLLFMRIALLLFCSSWGSRCPSAAMLIPANDRVAMTRAITIRSKILIFTVLLLVFGHVNLR